MGGVDGNGVGDIYLLNLPDVLDADNDGLDDGWETLFGAFEPAADPDGDGRTNAQEYAAGTHPNGVVRRFLAEGATGGSSPPTSRWRTPTRPSPRPPC